MSLAVDMYARRNSRLGRRSVRGHSRARRPASSAGFTLVELMVVVAIVCGVMVAAGPAFGTAFADRRALSATHDVIRLGRQAYWEAVRYRRAHVVSFTEMSGAGNDPGRVELIRGDTNLCNQDWANLRGTTTCGDANSRCIDWIDLSSADYLRGDVGPVLTMTSPESNARAVCYRPNGTVEVATTLSASFSADNTLSGGLILQVQTYDADDGVNEGVARRILYPLGGPPRRLR